MGEHSNVSFFVFLAILLFFLLSSSGKKKKQQEVKGAAPKPPHHSKRPLPVKTNSHRQPKEAPSYEVHKPKTPTPLGKGWNKKKSLKQAFILSEVLRRVDERERKF